MKIYQKKPRYIQAFQVGKDFTPNWFMNYLEKYDTIKEIKFSSQLNDIKENETYHFTCKDNISRMIMLEDYVALNNLGEIKIFLKDDFESKFILVANLLDLFEG